jgi:hypothetical protein
VGDSSAAPNQAAVRAPVSAAVTTRVVAAEGEGREHPPAPSTSAPHADPAARAVGHARPASKQSQASRVRLQALSEPKGSALHTGRAQQRRDGGRRGAATEAKRGPDVRPLPGRALPVRALPAASKPQSRQEQGRTSRSGQKTESRADKSTPLDTDSAARVRQAPAGSVAVRLSLHAWDAGTSGEEPAGTSPQPAADSGPDALAVASTSGEALQGAPERQNTLSQDEFKRRLQALEERSARSRMALAAALAEESRAGMVESQARTGVQLD